MTLPRSLAKLLIRGLLAPGLAVMVLTASGQAQAGLPSEKDALIEYIRAAIETKDYEALEALVFWKDVGKIKRRIVRFHLNRNLGRPIKEIRWEPFPEDGFDAAIATGKLAPNMEVSHAVKVIFDEPPIDEAGKLPTSVFLVGKREGVYRVGLVNRARSDDDDDD